MKKILILPLVFILVLLVGGASATQISVKPMVNISNNIETVWDGTQAYWIIKNETGAVVSYWTFPQVQSYRTTGQGSWQYEVPISLTANYISNGTLVQNFTLDSGSLLSTQFEDTADGVKMTWGIRGAYNRNYRIDFTSNSVPSSRNNLNETQKMLTLTDGFFYTYSDIDANYTVSSSLDANKNFHQYINVGNAYNQWKWIDPTITASDTVQYSGDAEASVSYGSYTKVKEIIMTDSYTGSWRITFDLQGGWVDDGLCEPGVDCEASTGVAKIYKNGVAWGTQHTKNAPGFASFSEDFSSLSISEGDLIQLYGWANPSNEITYSTVRNFRIKFNLPAGETYIPPSPTGIDSTSGNFFVNFSWATGAGNITDGYNVSVNGAWANTTNTYHNSTLSAHAWHNISVWSYNSTDGLMSLTSLDNNTRVPNNAISITNVQDDYYLTEGQTLNIDADYADADSDTGTFDRNFTQGNFNIGTGILSWTTANGDQGTYNWQVNVTDGYGSVSSKDFTVTVSDSTPVAPTTITPATGNFYIKWTWNEGTNADDYDVQVNESNVQHHADRYYNDTYSAHATKIISIRSHNHTLSSYSAWVNLTTTIPNNEPIQAAIGNKTVEENKWLNFSITTTDADSDSITYGTNASQGTLSGYNFSWKPSYGAAGTYIWYFNSSDGYGGLDNETITITVVEQAQFIPPAPVSLANTSGRYWVNHTWAAGAGNATTSYNVLVNSTWTNNSAQPWINTTTVADGWVNITVWAFNQSGNGSLSLISVSQNTQAPAAPEPTPTPTPTPVTGGGGGGGGWTPTVEDIVKKISDTFRNAPLLQVNQTGEKTAEITVRNEGNHSQEYIINWNVRDAKNAIVGSGVQSKMVAVNETYKLPITFKLPAGAYTLKATVQYGIYQSEASGILEVGATIYDYLRLLILPILMILFFSGYYYWNRKTTTGE